MWHYMNIYGIESYFFQDLFFYIISRVSSNLNYLPNQTNKKILDTNLI